MRYLVTAYNENDRPYCGTGFARNYTIDARQYRRTHAYKEMTRGGVAELWGVAYWLIRPWPHGTFDERPPIERVDNPRGAARTLGQLEIAAC